MITLATLKGASAAPSHSVTRREFLAATGKAGTAAILATGFAPQLLAGKGANETIGVGCIGLGTRGGDLISAVVPLPGVKVVAVCDVYAPHLQKGLRRSNNPDAKGYVDYRDLLADKHVEAVVIGTPDHWHYRMVLDAAKVRKDIYCEKGWGRSVEEAKEMRAAVKEAGVVFQLGHQARQMTCGVQAGELIRAGILGPVTLVRTGRYMNSPLGRDIYRWYGYYDAWERPDPAQVAKDLDWNRWLGDARKKPFNERHFWHWRCYWEYGTGIAGDLLSHELDFVQSILRYGVPDTCVTVGLNSLLKDDREVPDTWNATYQFEKQGCTVTFTASMNTNIGQPVEFCGKDAFLRFNGIAHDVTGFTIQREGFNPQTDLPAGYDPKTTPPQPNHMMDFFNCVRSRRKPKCNEDEAFIETATLVMSVESLQKKRQVRWDPVQQKIV